MCTVLDVAAAKPHSRDGIWVEAQRLLNKFPFQAILTQGQVQITATLEIQPVTTLHLQVSADGPANADVSHFLYF